MNFYSENEILNLHDDIKNEVKAVRHKRGFNALAYVEEKAKKINDYMKKSNLKSCVVAVSGGIDSAVVYAIVQTAKQKEDSPIKKVIPIFIPVYKSEGATNQQEAKAKAAELVKTFSDDELIEIDISSAHKTLKGLVDQAVGIAGGPWASGQLVSYLRTPTIYYVTSLMSQSGFAPIVCGTTNKDEGAYLGYFGKASDGMVDVQIISDIHKSEVYQAARLLGAPESIVQAVPTGDMYDNRSDEQVFGSPYDFVELYLHYINLDEKQKSELKSRLSVEALSQFEALSKNLDDLHQYNKHKYLGASPAVHLDVLPSKIKGGWIYNTF